MAAIHLLGPDKGVVVVGASVKLTFRLGALAMLLDRPAGMTTARVPLHRHAEVEGGDMTLSKTGRTLMVRVVEPARLYLAKADDARAFVKGELNAVKLLDVTEE